MEPETGTKPCRTVFLKPAQASPKNYTCAADLNAAGSSLSETAGKGFELVVYEKTGLGSGLMANNPWLQELA